MDTNEIQNRLSKIERLKVDLGYYKNKVNSITSEIKSIESQIAEIIKQGGQ